MYISHTYTHSTQTLRYTYTHLRVGRVFSMHTSVVTTNTTRHTIYTPYIHHLLIRLIRHIYCACLIALYSPLFFFFPPLFSVTTIPSFLQPSPPPPFTPPYNPPPLPTTITTTTAYHYSPLHPSTTHRSLLNTYHLPQPPPIPVHHTHSPPSLTQHPPPSTWS